jgi:hypothetical protein
VVNTEKIHESMEKQSIGKKRLKKQHKTYLKITKVIPIKQQISMEENNEQE